MRASVFTGTLALPQRPFWASVCFPWRPSQRLLLSVSRQAWQTWRGAIARFAFPSAQPTRPELTSLVIVWHISKPPGIIDEKSTRQARFPSLTPGMLVWYW